MRDERRLRRAGAFISTTLPTWASLKCPRLPAPPLGSEVSNGSSRRSSSPSSSSRSPRARRPPTWPPPSACWAARWRARARTRAPTWWTSAAAASCSRYRAGRRAHARHRVEKLYTSATALLRYGPDGRLTTTVLADELPDETGTIAGNIVLRGGGDPTFGASRGDRARREARQRRADADRGPRDRRRVRLRRLPRPAVLALPDAPATSARSARSPTTTAARASRARTSRPARRASRPRRSRRRSSGAA